MNRDLVQMHKEAEQRRLLRGGRIFLVFIRVALFAFLATGTALFIWTCVLTVTGKIQPISHALHPLLFCTLWSILILSLIRLVNSHIKGATSEEEAEPPVAR